MNILVKNGIITKVVYTHLLLYTETKSRILVFFSSSYK